MVYYTSIYVIVASVAAYTAAMPAPRWSRALESPFGKELQRCRNNWLEISQRENAQEISRCLHMLILAVVPKMTDPNGIPAIGTSQGDPLSFPGVLHVGGAGKVFKGELTQSRVVGITRGLTQDLSSASYDPVKKEFVLTVRFPEGVDVAADYKIELDAGAIFGQKGGRPVTTTGRVNGHGSNVVATQVVSFAKARSGELRVRSSRSNFEVENFRLNFKGSNPTDVLTGVLNAATSSREMALEILEEMKPPINKRLSENLGALFHRGWKALDQI